MQERFCECGHPILVSYQNLSRNSWLARFWSGARFFARTVERCPKCGRKLEVDVLR